MNRVILEDSKRKRVEIYADSALLTYRLTFKVPIKFLGFIVGTKNIWYEDHYPVFEDNEKNFDQIAKYCEMNIKNLRSRARKRRRNAQQVIKNAYENTLRFNKNTEQETQKENRL